MRTRSRRPFGTSVVLLFAVTLVATADACATHVWPRPPARPLVECGVHTEFIEDFRAYIQDLTLAADEGSVELRDSVRLPVVDTSLIQFVTDPATCDRAAVAHAREMGTDTLNPSRVWALRVGNRRYIVFDGTMAGEYFMHLVFDSAFVYLTAM